MRITSSNTNTQSQSLAADSASEQRVARESHAVNSSTQSEQSSDSISRSEFTNSAGDIARLLNNGSMASGDEQPIENNESEFSGPDMPPNIEYDHEFEGNNIGFFAPAEDLDIHITGNNNHVDVHGRSLVVVEGFNSTVNASGKNNVVLLYGKGHRVTLGDGIYNGAVIFGRGHTVNGSDGMNIIEANGVFHTVYAGGGNDDLRVQRGGEGTVIHAGEGDDWLNTGIAEGIEFYGDEGNDIVDLSSGTKNNLIHGGSGEDHFRIHAHSVGSEIHGDEGNDLFELSSGARDHVAFGGSGDDTFVGSAFDGSELHGGTGYDTIELDLPFTDSLVIERAPINPDFPNPGNDPVYVLRANAGGPVALTFSGAEHIQFDGGSAEPDGQGGWTLSAG